MWGSRLRLSRVSVSQDAHADTRVGIGYEHFDIASYDGLAGQRQSLADVVCRQHAVVFSSQAAASGWRHADNTFAACALTATWGVHNQPGPSGYRQKGLIFARGGRRAGRQEPNRIWPNGD